MQITVAMNKTNTDDEYPRLAAKDILQMNDEEFYSWIEKLRGIAAMQRAPKKRATKKAPAPVATAQSNTIDTPEDLL